MPKLSRREAQVLSGLWAHGKLPPVAAALGSVVRVSATGGEPMSIWREVGLLGAAVAALWGLHVLWTWWQQESNGAAMVAAVGLYMAILQLWRRVGP